MKDKPSHGDVIHSSTAVKKMFFKKQWYFSTCLIQNSSTIVAACHFTRLSSLCAGMRPVVFVLSNGWILRQEQGWVGGWAVLFMECIKAHLACSVKRNHVGFVVLNFSKSERITIYECWQILIGLSLGTVCQPTCSHQSFLNEERSMRTNESSSCSAQEEYLDQWNATCGRDLKYQR